MAMAAGRLSRLTLLAIFGGAARPVKAAPAPSPRSAVPAVCFRNWRRLVIEHALGRWKGLAALSSPKARGRVVLPARLYGYASVRQWVLVNWRNAASFSRHLAGMAR